MGRNKGDPARSKARPSSSSFAASLLHTPVASAIGFGGYVGSARVDTGPSADGELLMDVDGEAALHLRRLSKKDSTTKLKALTALTSLFKDRPSAELSALLPSWIFEYKRLVQDSSRQVRESSHIAMTAIVNSIGRGLAPHLRSLMGPWWVAQFDPSREVLEAAQTSFQVAFSGQKKRLDALIYCANEIFSHLEENFKLTPQTISDKATPIEEATEKHERVVSCSLLALAAIIDVLVGSLKAGPRASNIPMDTEIASKTSESVTESAVNLCRNQKFLREYVKSKSSRIRSAVYQALRAYIQHIPQVFRDSDMDLVVPSILGTFSEKDTACHQPMWDMVLLFAKDFPQAWGASSIRKSVFPKFFDFLRNGCNGSQQISYPSLLPLLSLIPAQFIIPGQSFLLAFFSNLWLGRSASQLGSTDRLALLNAVQECLIWTVKNSKRFSDAEGSNVVELQNALIDGVLLRLLWCDYIGVSSTHPVPSMSSATAIADEALDAPDIKQSQVPKAVDKETGIENISSLSAIPSEDFTQELGSCIVDAIRVLSGYDSNLFVTFWTEFQRICLSIVQGSGTDLQSRKKEEIRISRIAEFFVMLGSKTLNGESRDRWVLECAVRPFVFKAFPTIRSMGHPESIRLLAKLTSVYGPTAFFQLTASTAEHTTVTSESDSEDHKRMVKYFKDDIVPWCLDGDDELSGSKAELVLAFIQSPRFQEEWDFVVGHLTGWQNDVENRVDLEQVGFLATLLEKVREIGDISQRRETVPGQGNDNVAAWWKSSRIGSATLFVASSIHLSNPACFRLARSVLGGTSFKRSPTSIVSDTAAIQIFEILLMRILSVLSASDTIWMKSAPSLLFDDHDSHVMKLPGNKDLTNQTLELATSAINIVSECLLCLPSLDTDSTVGGKLVAALFCVRWACPKLAHTFLDDEDYESDLDSEEDAGPEGCDLLVNETAELSISRDADSTSDSLQADPSDELEECWKVLMDSIMVVELKLSSSFCKSFSALTRFRIRQVLIQCLRKAVLDENFDSRQQVSVKVAAWAQEVVVYTCEGLDEISQALDLLLAADDCWPRWVEVPSLQIETGMKLPICKAPEKLSEAHETQKLRHDRFACFVDLLCKTLGPREVFLRPTVQDIPHNEDEETCPEASSQTRSESCRTWLVVELLCTWEWAGGNATLSVLPLLCSLSKAKRMSNDHTLLWNTIETLFVGASQACSSRSEIERPPFSPFEDDEMIIQEPFLRALLKLLKRLLEMEDGWSKADTRDLFRQFVTKQDAPYFVSPICDIRILPSVLSLLMPTLRRKAGSDDETEVEWQLLLRNAVSEWLLLALTATPLVVCEEDSNNSGVKWIRVAVACFPLNSAGGVAAMASAFSMQVSPEEKALLLSLLQKQYSREAIAAIAGLAAVRRVAQDQAPIGKKSRQAVEVTLAKLVAAAIGYCWLSFGTEEWDFVLSSLRTWLEEAVLEAEEFTENVVATVKESPDIFRSEAQADSIVRGLESIMREKDIVSVNLSSTAVSIFSLLRGLEHLEGADSTDAISNLHTSNWKSLEMRALEDILRLLLAIGLAESAAASSSAGEEARNVIASWRKLQGRLWDNVADVALSASNQAREAAIRSVDLWGVGSGAISALYALLFSSQPTMSLQWVAYNFLTTGQVLQMAITCGLVNPGEGESKVEDDGGEDSQEALTATVAQIRPELTSVLETSPSLILTHPLTSPLRVRYLLGWALFLTRLPFLAASSSTRERLVQYVQDSDTSATLLDCLFQHIPLDPNVGGPGSRKKALGAAKKTSTAAAAAIRAAASGSVEFAVEGLWPVQKEGLVVLAGAMYGLMLLVLPACVRIWFTGLRDKAMASAIEAFTTIHCSPQLLSDEFAQVQASAVNEEEFSIRANRGLREVTAIYTKEEAGIDIVIKMPACYPLRAVGVECTRRMGIDETLLRKWILSMAAFLRNQNGAVSEAVQMWKRNVDREFEGVEPCPICYSIIHTSNHSLPKLACKTCRNKFHSACLYKWFSTSHQSTCPLCKTPF